MMPSFKPLSLCTPSPMAVPLTHDNQRACCRLQAKSSDHSQQLVVLRLEFPDTSDHPRRYAIIRLCKGKLTEIVGEKCFYFFFKFNSVY